VHRIDDYTEKELMLIFKQKVDDIVWFLDVTDQEIEDMIRGNKALFEHAGGSIEVWVSKCKMAHARRVFNLESYYKYRLVKDDLVCALDMMKDMTLSKKVDDIPLGLYM